MDEIADCIDAVLKAIDTDALEDTLTAVKARVATLASDHPLPY